VPVVLKMACMHWRVSTAIDTTTPRDDCMAMCLLNDRLNHEMMIEDLTVNSLSMVFVTIITRASLSQHEGRYKDHCMLPKRRFWKKEQSAFQGCEYSIWAMDR
jgi:hypothetical protein